MPKQTGWIHGGKYVKPGTPGRPVHSTPIRRAKQVTNRSTQAEPILSQLCTCMLVLLGHLVPFIVTISKTIATFIMMMIGGIIYGVQFARSKLVVAQQQIRSPRQLHSPVSSVHFPPLNVQNVPSTSSKTRTSPPTSTQHVQTNAAASSHRPSHPPSANTTKSNNKATPAKSLLRQTSRRDSFGSQQPRSARRVLFTETSEGEVHRTEVLYDKELPASARKVQKETRESLERRVAEANKRRTSYSPGALVASARQNSSPLDPSTRVATGNQQRLPLAVVNQSAVSPENQLSTKHNSPISVPMKAPSLMKAPSPVKMRENKRPAPQMRVTDANQKRRNLIAISRYNNNNNRYVRPAIGFRAPVYGNANLKRQREEVEDWVWKAMNKKGKVAEPSLDGKTPLKVRPQL